MNQFELSKSDAENLLSLMIIFAIGIVLTDKLRDGSIDLPTAQEMVSSYNFETIPKKKNI